MLIYTGLSVGSNNSKLKAYLKNYNCQSEKEQEYIKKCNKKFILQKEIKNFYIDNV